MVEPHAVLLVIKHSAVKAVRILYAATLLPEHTQHQPFSGPENGFSQTITLLYLSQWHTKHNGSISTTIEIDTFFSQRKDILLAIKTSHRAITHFEKLKRVSKFPQAVVIEKEQRLCAPTRNKGGCVNHLFTFGIRAVRPLTEIIAQKHYKSSVAKKRFALRRNGD